MVEPAGAMAMFVLRLAGLLSLENAIKEQEVNLTQSHLNLTSLGFTPGTSNFTWSSSQYVSSHVSPRNTSNPRMGEVTSSPATSIPRTGETTSPVTSNPRMGEVTSSPATSIPRTGETTSPATSNPRMGEVTALVTPSHPATTTSTSVDNLSPPAPTLTTHSTIDSFKLSRINESLVNHSGVLASVPSYIGNEHSSTNKSSLPDQSDNKFLKTANDSIEMLPRASPLSDVRDNVSGNDINTHGSHSLQNTDSQHIKQEETDSQHIKQEETDSQHIKQEETDSQHIQQEETDSQHIKQEETDSQHIQQEETDSQHIQQEETDSQHIKQEETDSQHIKREEPERLDHREIVVQKVQGGVTGDGQEGADEDHKERATPERGTESVSVGSTEPQGRETEPQGRGTEPQERGTEPQGRHTDPQGRHTESPGRDTKLPAVIRTRIRKGKGTSRKLGRGDTGHVSSNPGRGDSLPVDMETVRHIDYSTLSPTLAATTPSTRPRLRLEALVEDDDVSALIDAPRLVDLEAPSEGFVESDFEYYDFGSRQQLVTPKPTLSSLSLVSAVPARPPSRPPEPRRKNRVRKPAPARPRKVPPARPIPQVPPQQPVMRNNPYPYGPKVLPGPYTPLTPNLPPARENSEERVATEYNYEEELDYYYDPGNNEESRYEVQTREPPVLFVFDKPGYSPEAPTTMAPPTRAPTPSDPWDCAPRCPRYTLLDWSMDYDVRLYPETLWVSTVIISDNRVLAELEGYMRVQDYFYGLNDQGMVLNLTVPFMTQIKFGKHPGVLEETNDYTVSLYVQPTYYQHVDLPTPISNEVLVDELEAKTVFVHSFEANVWDVTENFLQEKVQTLMEQLRHNGEAFLDRYYYLASYSRPELYQAVYYEIWIYATNFRDPQTNTKSSHYNRRPQTNKVTQKTLNKLCRGVECPKFEVLRTYKYGIQKRRYYHGLFASTSPRECQFTTMSVWKGFMPLHLYKHGVNSHMEVIEATRPIALVHIRDSTAPDTECPQNLTMSLYLPQRLHSNPPITGYAAPSVHITDLDDVIVYAYTVGGYLLDPARVRKELSDMKYRLSEFGACYKDDEHYVVIYDFIVRYHGRQNEIWIVAENCKATHNG